MSERSDSQTQSKPVVLIIDDSLDDLMLAEMAMRKVAPHVTLRTMQSGAEAIAYLVGQNNFADRAQYPLPTLVLLDLKMPRVSGYDVLSALQAANISKPPYICVLTTSRLQTDIDKATSLGADAFDTKPGSYADLCNLLSRLTTFYCNSQLSRSSA